MPAKNPTNEEHFHSLLRAVSSASPEFLEDRLSAFLELSSVDDLVAPWQKSEALLSLFQSLATLVEDLRLELRDLISRDDEIYYNCIAKGQSHRTEREIHWKFAGRLRYSRHKIVACVLYTDFIALFKQVGSLPGEDVENDQFGEPESLVKAPPQAGGEFEDFSDFLRICDASRWGALVCDLEDRILAANEILAAFLQQDESQLSARRFEEFLFPGDLALNAECLERLDSTEAKNWRAEFRLMRGSSVVWLELCLFQRSRLSGRDVLLRAFSESARLDRAFRFLQQERAHLSRELHDSLAQDAAALWMFLNTPTEFVHPATLGLAKRMADEAGELMYRLKNPVREGISLSMALQEFIERKRFEKGLEVDLRVEGTFENCHAASLVAFRLVQEALQNVAKHAAVFQAQVSIKQLGGEMWGEISDEGRGFDPEQSPANRFGLRGMRERCEILGGSFAVISKPSKGTRIRFRLPLGGADMGVGANEEKAYTDPD